MVRGCWGVWSCVLGLGAAATGSEPSYECRHIGGAGTSASDAAFPLPLVLYNKDVPEKLQRNYEVEIISGRQCKLRGMNVTPAQLTHKALSLAAP